MTECEPHPEAVRAADKIIRRYEQSHGDLERGSRADLLEKHAKLIHSAIEEHLRELRLRRSLKSPGEEIVRAWNEREVAGIFDLMEMIDTALALHKQKYTELVKAAEDCAFKENWPEDVDRLHKALRKVRGESDV